MSEEIFNFRVEGNKGETFVEIERTANPEIIRLYVGDQCVHMVRREIPVTLLAEVLIKAFVDGVEGFNPENDYVFPEPKLLDGSTYVDYEFDDETSAHDPKGRWQGGSDCYTRTYRCRIPRRLKPENIDAWLAKNEGRVKYLD